MNTLSNIYTPFTGWISSTSNRIATTLLDLILLLWKKTEKFRISSFEFVKNGFEKSFKWISAKTAPLRERIWNVVHHNTTKNLAISSTFAAAGGFLFCICPLSTGLFFGAAFYSATALLFKSASYLENCSLCKNYFVSKVISTSVFVAGYLIAAFIAIQILRSPLTYSSAISLAVFSAASYAIPYISSGD